MKKFTDLLDEITECRLAGFFRPALFETLSIPDICGTAKFGKSYEKKYEEWLQEYVISESFPIGLTAEEIYKLRCCLFHGNNIRVKGNIPYVFDFSNAKHRWPHIRIAYSQPSICQAYKIIDCGYLMNEIVSGARTFYEEIDESKKAFLDAYDELVSYENPFFDLMDKYTTSYVNGKEWKQTKRDK